MNKKSAQKQKRLVTTASRKRLFHPRKYAKQKRFKKVKIQNIQK